MYRLSVENKWNSIEKMPDGKSKEINATRESTRMWFTRRSTHRDRIIAARGESSFSRSRAFSDGMILMIFQDRANSKTFLPCEVPAKSGDWNPWPNPGNFTIVTRSNEHSFGVRDQTTACTQHRNYSPTKESSAIVKREERMKTKMDNQ